MSETIETAFGRFTAGSAKFLRHTATAEPLQLKLMRRAFRALDGVDTFFDVGANLGVYSIFLGNSGACRRMIAFEPGPATFKELSANLDLNFGGTGRVEAHNAAVSAEPGEAQFDTRRSLGPGARILSREGQKARGEVISVPTVRLDDVIGEGARDAILKMDVEGHELQALAGADQTVRNRCAVAQVECWAGKKFRRQQLRAYMEERGFSLLCRVKGDHIFLHESVHEALAGPLMETYYQHSDDANQLLERLSLYGVKAEMNREISARAVKLYNGFEGTKIGAWRRRIDRLAGRKGGKNG